MSTGAALSECTMDSDSFHGYRGSRSEMHLDSDSFHGHKSDCVQMPARFGQFSWAQEQPCPNALLIRTAFIMIVAAVSKIMLDSDNFHDHRSSIVRMPARFGQFS